MKHVIIVPVHNEEKYLTVFLDSLIAQSLKPNLVVIVDDNSTDNSAKIIKAYSKAQDWINYVFRDSEPIKVQGSKVIQAFNYGLNQVSLDGYDIITKLDADLKLPPDYCKGIINAFLADPIIGIAGGIIYEKESDKWIKKHIADYHIRGALKSYRVEAFQQINGLLPVFGWDGLDEMTLFYHGWKSLNVELAVKHFRPAAKDYNSLKLSLRWGACNYRNGSNLFMALVRSMVKIFEKPYLLKGVFFLFGYIKSFFQREGRHVDPDLARFINNFHMKRLMSGTRN